MLHSPHRIPKPTHNNIHTMPEAEEENKLKCIRDPPDVKVDLIDRRLQVAISMLGRIIQITEDDFSFVE
jgi:hypothetical protein